MNAAVVLAHALVPKMSDLATDKLLAALLAHGEQGVAILPDGTMWALVFHGEDYGPSDEDVKLFRLEPEEIEHASAEAGDTDG